MRHWKCHLNAQMPFSREISTQPFSTPADLSGFLPFLPGKRLIACWYGGIKQTHQDKTQPKVEVTFRIWQKSNPPYGNFKVKLPLTALEHARLGSIWRGGKAEELAFFEEETFDLHFTENQTVYFTLKSLINSDYFEPRQLITNTVGFEKGWLTQLPLPTGGSLFVPSIEVFSRLYGYSQELTRVLATYDQHEIENRLLLPITPETEEEDLWKVRVAPRFARNDALHIAHFKYDPYTKKCFNSIYSQLEANHSNIPPKHASTPLAYPQIPPWFLGNARLKVRGFWLRENSFLALNIVGCSEPEGPPIIRYEFTSPNDPSYPEDEFTDYYVGRAKVPPGETGATLTGDQEPDHLSPTVMLPGAIGVEGRRRLQERREYSGNRGPGQHHSSKCEEDPDRFGGGDPYGSGKGVGRDCSYAELLLDSKGALRDFWDALLELQEADSTVKKVEWFTFNEGFCESSDPKLQPLVEPKGNTPRDQEARTWLLKREPGEKHPTPRGILIVRATIDGKVIFFLEIQRKLCQPIAEKRKEARNREPYPESFKGMVFSTGDHEEALSWLEEILHKIPYKRGVLDKIAPHCPGQAGTYIHPSPKEPGEAPGQRALKIALRKLK